MGLDGRRPRGDADGVGFEPSRRFFPRPLGSGADDLGLVLPALQRRVVEDREELLLVGDVDVVGALQSDLLDDLGPVAVAELLPLVGGFELGDHGVVVGPELLGGCLDGVTEAGADRVEQRTDRVGILQELAPAEDGVALLVDLVGYVDIPGMVQQRPERLPLLLPGGPPGDRSPPLVEIGSESLMGVCDRTELLVARERPEVVEV